MILARGGAHGRLNPMERTMRKTRNAMLGILTMMSGAILAVPTEAAERYAPCVHVYKAAQSEFSVIAMGAAISRGGSLPTSAATTGVTTPPHTTATTGITALLTIGNTAARQQAAGSRQQAAGSRQQAAG